MACNLSVCAMTAWDISIYTRPQRASPGSIADLRNHMATAPISYDWWKGKAIVRTYGRPLGLAVERDGYYSVSLVDGKRRLDRENLDGLSELWREVNKFMGMERV